MEVAALVLGIVALVLGCAGPFGWIGTICAIVGLVLGILGVKKAGEKKGLAKAGMIMSIVALAISIIFTVACTICMNKAGKALKKAVESEDWSSLTETLKEYSSDEDFDWDAWAESLGSDLNDAASKITDDVASGLGDLAGALSDGLKSIGSE